MAHAIILGHSALDGWTWLIWTVTFQFRSDATSIKKCWCGKLDLHILKTAGVTIHLCNFTLEMCNHVCLLVNNYTNYIWKRVKSGNSASFSSPLGKSEASWNEGYGIAWMTKLLETVLGLRDALLYSTSSTSHWYVFVNQDHLRWYISKTFSTFWQIKNAVIQTWLFYSSVYSFKLHKYSNCSWG